MLREIEASLALWKSVTFDFGTSVVTWVLPASKADPKALGKSRSWGCLCSDTVGDGPGPCPYHALLAQRQAVASTFDLDAADLAGYPVFPDTDGSVCQKQAVVDTAKVVAGLLGMSDDLVKGVTGHVCRITGAQHLARLGFDVVLIQLMARWASEIVRHYIAEAPLGSITDRYRKLAAGRRLDDVLDSLVSEVEGLRGRLDNMVAPVAVALETERMVKTVAKTVRPATGPFVRNIDSDKAHWPTEFRSNGEPAKVTCGWCVEPGSFEWLHKLPTLDPRLLCGICLPTERRAVIARRSQMSSALHAGSDDDGSSSGLSSSSSEQ